MSPHLFRRKRYSTFAVKQRTFAIGLAHSLQDALNALIPVAIAGVAISFLVWFWGSGPTTLSKDLFGFDIGILLWARIFSTFLVGFPTAVFVRSSFVNFLHALSDSRAIDRELAILWDEIAQRDGASRGGQS